MGVTADQLFRNALDYIVKREMSILFSNNGVKRDVQQEIAQFFLQVLPVFIVYRVKCFIGFFDRCHLYRVVCLLAIPGAFLPEPSHYINKFLKFKLCHT